MKPLARIGDWRPVGEETKKIISDLPYRRIGGPMLGALSVYAQSRNPGVLKDFVRYALDYERAQSGEWNMRVSEDQGDAVLLLGEARALLAETSFNKRAIAGREDEARVVAFDLKRLVQSLVRYRDASKSKRKGKP